MRSKLSVTVLETLVVGLIATAFVSGCRKDDAIEHKLLSSTQVHLPSGVTEYLVTYEHDGHWFISNGKTFIHHPSCPKERTQTIR
jgi:hypothetical protein